MVTRRIRWYLSINCLRTLTNFIFEWRNDEANGSISIEFLRHPKNISKGTKQRSNPLKKKRNRSNINCGETDSLKGSVRQWMKCRVVRFIRRKKRECPVEIFSVGVLVSRLIFPKINHPTTDDLSHFNLLPWNNLFVRSNLVFSLTRFVLTRIVWIPVGEFVVEFEYKWRIDLCPALFDRWEDESFDSSFTGNSQFNASSVASTSSTSSTRSSLSVRLFVNWSIDCLSLLKNRSEIVVDVCRSSSRKFPSLVSVKFVLASRLAFVPTGDINVRLSPLILIDLCLFRVHFGRSSLRLPLLSADQWVTSL